jgi:hypothetical protein
MSGVSVIPFRREHAADFRRLNVEWIERLFKVEAADLKVLDRPHPTDYARSDVYMELELSPARS